MLVNKTAKFGKDEQMRKQSEAVLVLDGAGTAV